jgi:hypothetical protein
MKSSEGSCSGVLCALRRSLTLDACLEALPICVRSYSER